MKPPYFIFQFPALFLVLAGHANLAPLAVHPELVEGRTALSFSLRVGQEGSGLEELRRIFSPPAAVPAPAAGLEEPGIESLTGNLVGAWNQLLPSAPSESLTADRLQQLKKMYDEASREGKITIKETLWAAAREAIQELYQRRMESPPSIASGQASLQNSRVFVPMFIGYLDFSVLFRKEGEALGVNPAGLSLTPASAQTNLLRALNFMATPFKTVGTFGNGIRGSMYLDLLWQEGVMIRPGDWMKISGEDTGLNFFTVFREEGFDIEDLFIAPAPAWTDQEKAEYLRRVDEATEEMAGGIFALSMPPPFNAPELMAQLLRIARRNGMFTLYDPKPDVVGNQSLIESILPGLDLFKPNLRELAVLLGLLEMEDAALRRDPERIVRESRRLMDRYDIRMMLVSLDKDGALLVDRNRAAFARPPQIEVASSVGAGDTALAALIDRYLRRDFSLNALTDEQVRELVQVFVAAGTATSLKPGTELASASEIHAMERQVQSFIYPNKRLGDLVKAWPAAGLEEKLWDEVRLLVQKAARKLNEFPKHGWRIPNEVSRKMEILQRAVSAVSPDREEVLSALRSAIDGLAPSDRFEEEADLSSEKDRDMRIGSRAILLVAASLRLERAKTMVSSGLLKEPPWKGFITPEEMNRVLQALLLSDAIRLKR